MYAVEAIRRHAKFCEIRRPTSPTVTDGYVIKGAPTKKYGNICIQPLTGEEVRNLAPGQNWTDMRSAWSDAELRPLDQVMAPDGSVYTVQRLLPWDEGNFWYAMLSRVVDAPAPSAAPQ
jgi:hypothetical protein